MKNTNLAETLSHLKSGLNTLKERKQKIDSELPQLLTERQTAFAQLMLADIFGVLAWLNMIQNAI